MSQNSLSPHDPKFTAYALGELEPEERAAVEAALRDNPAARAAVEEIRATAAQLSAALAAEPEPAAAASCARIIPGHDRTKLDGGPRPYEEKKLIRFPQAYYIVGLAAAACFAVVVALREPAYHPPRQVAVAHEVSEKSYTTIDLGAAAVDVEASVPANNQPTAGLAAPAVSAPTVSLEPPELRLADAGMPPPQRSEPLIAPMKAEQSAPAPVAEVRIAVAPLESPVPASGSSATSRAPVVGGYELSVDKESVNRFRGVAGGAAPAPATLAENQPKADAAVVVLSPFQVSTSQDRGYTASNTLSGSRLALSSGSIDEVAERRFRPRGAGNTEGYASNPDSDFLGARENPLSTFAIDVDTASYANVRRFLQSGQLPPADAVRVEEMVNYFPYAYPPPKNDEPFAASLEVAAAAWAPEHRLVRIGLKAREVATKDRPAANLVFLLDVSGSMNESNKLPLVKESLRLLLGKLRADDRVAIVTYAGESGLALPSTPVARSREILEALDALSPGGSTNGVMGIQLAYDIAKANFVTDGLNRVILCTDGDFNVGVSSEGALTRLIGEKAKSGVFLTVLGFGMGNLKDSMLEKLADRGNGNYGYIDTRREAEKLLVAQVNGTLMTIAKDVKIQVEFNPAKVASYRLIGYENRLLKKEDFNNDAVDAGEIGAGHTVTALYEIVPVGGEDESSDRTAAVDDLKYQLREPARAKVATSKAKVAGGANDELLTVKVRYKNPRGIFSRKLEFPLTDAGGTFASATADFKFAAAVASFGMLLRDSPHKGNAALRDIATWAGNGANDDLGGERGEFIDLVNVARRLMR